MREIKFRAWDKKNNLWYGRLGKPFTIQDAMVADWSTPTEQLIFMQYTVLKDKNGVEIYEGDVIAYTNHTKTLGDVYHRRVVEWHDEVARFSMHKIGKHTSDPKANEYSLFKAEKMQKLEIIGNIYENPELLEKSDV